MVTACTARAAPGTCAAQSSIARRSSRQPPRASAPALAINSTALLPAAPGLACVRGPAGCTDFRACLTPSAEPLSDNDGVAHVPETESPAKEATRAFQLGVRD